MNKKITFTLIGSMLCLIACNAPQEEIKIISKQANMYFSNAQGEVVSESINLYFKNNEDIPYLDSSLISELLDYTISKANNHEGNIYSHSVNNGVMKIKQNYLDTYCEINPHNNSIKFDDFSSFTSSVYNEKFALVNKNGENNKYVSANKETTGKDYKYIPGKEININLNEYETLDVLNYENKVLIPYATINSIFLGTSSYYCLGYNFNDLYLFSYEEIVGMNKLDEGIVKLYKDGAESISEFSNEYTKFNYEQLLLQFTYNWGNNSNFGNIKDFDKFFEEKGLKDDLLSGVPHLIDEAIYSITNGYLCDLHTIYIGNSIFTKSEDFNKENTFTSPDFLEFNNIIANYYSAKFESVVGISGLYKDLNSLYFMFNSFSDSTNVELNPPYEYEAAMKASTIHQFAYLHQYLEKNPEIENVIIDITLNTGGSTDTLMYTVGSLIGDFCLYTQDPITGAKTEQYVAIDINSDGKFDENDKSLKEKGYNLAVITSPISFSCGNAFPYVLKDNCEEVVILGTESGGGTCALYPAISATGTIFSMSGRIMFSIKDGEEYKNIEAGITPDYRLSMEESFDFKSITTLLNNEIFK